MLMKDFRKLVKSTNPCGQGWRWFLRKTRNKTVQQFFEDLKTAKHFIHSYNSHYNPHAYLVYMFRMCLNHKNLKMYSYSYGAFQFSPSYQDDYLKKLLNINSDFEIPIPQLCDILAEAFGDNYEQYI